MPILFQVACAIVLTAPLAGDSAGADKFNIRFRSIDHVGDTFNVDGIVVVTGRVSRSFPNNQSNFQNFNSFVALEGAVKVLEVDKNGEASKYECTVDLAISDGKLFCQKGKVIIAERRESSEVFTIDGKAAEPTVSEALSSILPTHNPNDNETLDTMVGTSQPQPVGATWPVNREALARSIANHRMTPDKANIRGQHKLVSVKERAGKRYLQIDYDLQFAFSGALPDGAQIERREIEQHGSELIPADGSGGSIRREETESSHSIIHVQTEDKQPATDQEFIRRDKLVNRTNIKTNAPAK